MKMKTSNPEYIQRICKIVSASPYFELLSMKLLDAGAGFSLLEIDLAKKHLQPFGTVHGGVFSSIIDAAAFWAVYPGIEDPAAGMTTVDLKLNYLAPAETGKMIARGRSIKVGRTLGLADAEVTDRDGKLLAHGTSTLMLIQGLGLEHIGSVPEKFVEEG